MKGDSAVVSTTEAPSTSAQVQHEAAVLSWNLSLGVTLRGRKLNLLFVRTLLDIIAQWKIKWCPSSERWVEAIIRLLGAVSHYFCHWFELRGCLIRLKCSERRERQEHTLIMWAQTRVLSCENDILYSHVILRPPNSWLTWKRGKGEIPRRVLLMDKTSRQLNSVIKCLVGILAGAFRKLLRFTVSFISFLFFSFLLSSILEISS